MTETASATASPRRAGRARCTSPTPSAAASGGMAGITTRVDVLHRSTEDVRERRAIDDVERPSLVEPETLAREAEESDGGPDGNAREENEACRTRRRSGALEARHHREAPRASSAGGIEGVRLRRCMRRTYPARVSSKEIGDLKAGWSTRAAGMNP